MTPEGMHVHVYDASTVTSSPRISGRWSLVASGLALLVLIAAVAYVIIGIFSQTWGT
jgi:hypothetical protein